MAEEVKKKKGIFKEFKEFITRGNVIDLAVGIIIGGAFTAIVTALTSGVLQPLINWVLSLIFRGQGLEGCRTVLGEAVIDSTGAIDWSKTIYIDWGTLISAIINFLLVAIVLFIIIKAINKVHDASEKAAKVIAEKVTTKKENNPDEETK